MKIMCCPLFGSGLRLLRRRAFSTPLLFLVASAPSQADVNSWTKPISGFWEEQAFWSMGVPPDAAQDVVFTNANWKALAIGTNVLQQFPESMQVRSLRVGAPADSFNTLLLNFTGFERPLQTESLVVETNSAVVIQGSALELGGTNTDSNSVNFLLGGTVNHGDFSWVKVHGRLTIFHQHQFVSDVLEPGAYFLTNGLLSVDGSISMGGMGPGKLVQHGGSNNVGGIGVSVDGQYRVDDGQVIVTNGITVGFGDLAGYASFVQNGGRVIANTTVNGSYVLNGGRIAGTMSVPGNSFQRVNGSVLQKGGTNSAVSMNIGFPNRFGGAGSYILTNGALLVDSSTTFRGGWFYQYDGQHTIVSNLVMQGQFVGPGNVYADYTLMGGTLSVGGLTVQSAHFNHGGGTNLIAGDLVLGTTPSIPLQAGAGRYVLAGGALSAGNITVNVSYYGSFRQTGGSNRISERLTVQGVTNGVLEDYTLEGGTLAVRDIEIGAGAFFQHIGGDIIQSGVLTLNHGEWRAATGDHSLGPLQLPGAQSEDPAVKFPNGSSVLRLADSSAQPWASSAILYITNWHGSTSGGGQTQLYFGSNANGLTAQQLAQVKFAFSGGVSAARILATGEVVPRMQPLSFSRSGNTLTLAWEPGWTLQSSTNVAGPYEDVQGATSPYAPPTGRSSEFFRLRQ